MGLRIISSEDLVQLAVKEIGKLACEPDPLILPWLQNALQKEESPLSRDVLSTLCQNIQIAHHERIPLCQDTGSLVVFAELGTEIQLVGGTLQQILNRAMQIAQEKFYFRASILNDPVNMRKNSGDNTPVILHLDQVEGDALKLILGLKGGGAENMSRLKMFAPCAGEREITEFVIETVTLAGSKACPPLVIGIGIGGNFESCARLAKRALFDPLDQPNPDRNYAELEQTILGQVNETGIGAGGLGGKNTAMAVKIRTAACHIASLPVAVNLQCHAHRHGLIVL